MTPGKLRIWAPEENSNPVNEPIENQENQNTSTIDSLNFSVIEELKTELSRYPWDSPYIENALRRLKSITPEELAEIEASQIEDFITSLQEIINSGNISQQEQLIYTQIGEIMNIYNAAILEKRRLNIQTAEENWVEQLNWVEIGRKITPQNWEEAKRNIIAKLNEEGISLSDTEINTLQDFFTNIGELAKKNARRNNLSGKYNRWSYKTTSSPKFWRYCVNYSQ